QNSFLHDTKHLEKDPLRDYTPTHDDLVQIQAGSSIVIKNNRMTGTKNTDIMVTQDTGKVADLTISGNYIDGGNCSININQKNNGALRNVKIKSNLFGPNRTIANCAVYKPAAGTITLSGNIWQATGKSVTALIRK
ncbi:MAG: hypothetical protein QM607_09375, partial [Microbacterium sp.]